MTRSGRGETDIYSQASHRRRRWLPLAFRMALTVAVAAVLALVASYALRRLNL